MYRIIKSSSDTESGYWYLFRHGSGPRTIPKDVQLLESCDHPTNPWKFYGKLSRMLTTDELKYYDLKEEMPLVECSAVKSHEDFVVDYPLTDEYVSRTLRKYDRMSRRDEGDYYDRLHAEGKYEGEEPEDIYSAVSPWKTRYTVHWMSPDGRDCLLAGNNNLDNAVQSGIHQVEELLDSPWETDERRLLFLENMYIAEGDKVIDTELDDYVDGVMSFIQSRMKTKRS